MTTVPLPSDLLDRLRRFGPVAGPDGWREALPRAEAVVMLLTIPVDPGFLEAAPRLRLVANAAVGFDNVDVAACARRGIAVTNTPGVLTAATADLTLALMLAAVRRLPAAERSLRRGEFEGWGFWDYLGGDLEGATLGIFGMGRIGRGVARRARAFGMRIIYTTRTPLDPPDAGVAAEPVAFDALLARSDVLSLHAPGTPDTRRVLDESAIRAMKRGAVLINTARGSLVDEAALASAVRSGHLAGAGLDVYDREPEVHPDLLGLDGVVLLPHIGSATHGTRRRMAELAVQNVEAMFEGRPLPSPVPGSVPA